jgi:hypothetical protein
VRIQRAVLRAIVFVVLARACSFAEAQKIVKRVVIHSSAGGLGSGLSTVVVIKRKGDQFLSNTRMVEIYSTSRGLKTRVMKQKGNKSLDKDRPVSAVQVQSLVAALAAAPLTKLDTANLGITNEWLASKVESQWPPPRVGGTETTADQKKLFQKSFTNLNLVAKNVWPAFISIRLDYSAFCKVEVVFDDGPKLSAESYSDSPFMLPWSMKGRRFTYNADISRAIAALLPAESANQDTLAGDELASELAAAVMISIEPEWNLLGSEEPAGEALKTLRTAYEVIKAGLTPYLLPEYGTYTYSGAPEEMNLLATVRKSNFPANLTDALVLRYADKKVEGVDAFLKSAAKYEDLVLSVPWLNGYIRDNPGATVRISYIHDKSFGDKAMDVFAADMKRLVREDLIEQVKSQQAGIALLLINDTSTQSYWLVFPDKHMMLWRYDGSSRLLKWTPEDFRKGERQCSDRLMVCSGQEITAEGTLVSDTHH